MPAEARIGDIGNLRPHHGIRHHWAPNEIEEAAEKHVMHERSAHIPGFGSVS
tara:strand:- start:488 stop:643 length:156 start_codon:yes stop_codon:yes gene_type:complete